VDTDVADGGCLGLTTLLVLLFHVQSLKKQLAAEQQLSARHVDENATLRQTVTRLTALAQGSATSANPKDTWAEIVSENHRLRADKSSLFRRLNETESSLSAENKQLSRMVQSSCTSLLF